MNCCYSSEYVPEDSWGFYFILRLFLSARLVEFQNNQIHCFTQHVLSISYTNERTLSLVNRG